MTFYKFSVTEWIMFREIGDEMCVETWLTEGAKVRCSLVLGNGKKTMVVTVVRQRGNKIFFG